MHQTPFYNYSSMTGLSIVGFPRSRCRTMCAKANLLHRQTGNANECFF